MVRRVLDGRGVVCGLVSRSGAGFRELVFVAVVVLLVELVLVAANDGCDVCTREKIALSVKVLNAKKTLTRTKLHEERHNRDDRVHDLLPGLEGELAVLDDPRVVLDRAALHERPAGEHEVQEGADCGAFEEVDDPDHRRVRVHHAAVADDGANEAVHDHVYQRAVRYLRNEQETHPNNEVRHTIVESTPATMMTTLPFVLMSPKSTLFTTFFAWISAEDTFVS